MESRRTFIGVAVAAVAGLLGIKAASPYTMRGRMNGTMYAEHFTVLRVDFYSRAVISTDGVGYPSTYLPIGLFKPGRRALAINGKNGWQCVACEAEPVQEVIEYGNGIGTLEVTGGSVSINRGAV